MSGSIVSLYQIKYKESGVLPFWIYIYIYTYIHVETWHIEYIFGLTFKNKHYVTENAHSQEMTKMIHNNEDIPNTFRKTKNNVSSSNQFEIRLRFNCHFLAYLGLS